MAVMGGDVAMAMQLVRSTEAAPSALASDAFFVFGLRRKGARGSTLERSIRRGGETVGRSHASCLRWQTLWSFPVQRIDMT